ncbi:hypothetical protein QDR37_10450 [Amnibacterium sp. CER49]|uniref:hypothetical protein n=1 Tax=Amnibacterium sp. CER49 TaxID=3039161 RepID=UPI00244AC162|nr:hypothetical protein [Amnibacterium sp. CER49]MDH2444362.1 hypothetical protein [Amnibacterium sp. CER49]
MPRTVPLAAAGLGVAAALTAVLAAPAVAATTGGASVTHYSSCDPLFADYVDCAVIHGTTNTVQTPSGNLIVQLNQRYSNTISQGATVVSTDSGAIHSSSVISIATQTTKVQRSISLGSQNVGGRTCTIGVRYHVTANGVQFDSTSTVCS